MLEKQRKNKYEKLNKKQKQKNKVQFKYDIKLAKMQKQTSGFGNWIRSFFKKEDNPVKALASIEHIPEQNDVPKNEYHTTVQAGQTAFIQFKVFNRAQNDWDSGCYLINDYDGGLHENFFELRKSIKSNHMFYLEIQIQIPAIVHEQTLQIHFQFVTPRLRPFGDRMIAKIHIVHDCLENVDCIES